MLSGPRTARYRPNCRRNSLFARSSVRRRLAGSFLPARLI
jgi:hypothetical protein